MQLDETQGTDIRPIIALVFSSTNLAKFYAYPQEPLALYCQTIQPVFHHQFTHTICRRPKFLKGSVFNPLFIKGERDVSGKTLAIDFIGTIAKPIKISDGKVLEFRLRTDLESDLQYVKENNIRIVLWTGRPREEVSQFFKQFPQIAPFFDFVITGENFNDHENNENFGTSYQTFAPDSYRTKAKQIYTESAARGHRIKDYFLLKYFGLIADDCQDMASALQEIHPFEKIRVYSIPECGENTSCEESLGYTFHRLTSDLEFEF